MGLIVYKLRYNTREEGISDLLSKGIILSDLSFSLPTHSVVDLNNGLFDIMVEQEYDFGINEINPITPNHMYGGW